MTAKEELIEDSVNVKSPKDRRLLLVIALASASLFILCGIAAYLAYTAISDQAAKGKTLADQVREACADPRLNTEEMQDICKQAEEVASEPIPSNPLQGAKGDPGPPPSDAQVARAVASYCISHTCRGASGQNATQAQVRNAIAMYCNARGECIGPEGTAGKNGQDGQNGKDGAQGPPPSAQQVADAVKEYCSTRNECQGPAGANGAPGRGIQTVACTQGSASFTITYTDGTTETVECPGGLLPDEGE